MRPRADLAERLLYVKFLEKETDPKTGKLEEFYLMGDTLDCMDPDSNVCLSDLFPLHSQDNENRGLYIVQKNTLMDLTGLFEWCGLAQRYEGTKGKSERIALEPQIQEDFAKLSETVRIVLLGAITAEPTADALSNLLSDEAKKATERKAAIKNMGVVGKQLIDFVVRLLTDPHFFFCNSDLRSVPMEVSLKEDEKSGIRAVAEEVLILSSE